MNHLVFKGGWREIDPENARTLQAIIYALHCTYRRFSRTGLWSWLYGIFPLVVLSVMRYYQVLLSCWGWTEWRLQMAGDLHCVTPPVILVASLTHLELKSQPKERKKNQHTGITVSFTVTFWLVTMPPSVVNLLKVPFCHLARCLSFSPSFSKASEDMDPKLILVCM